MGRRRPLQREDPVHHGAQRALGDVPGQHVEVGLPGVAAEEADPAASVQRAAFLGMETSGQRLFAANEVTDTIVGFDLKGDGQQLRPLRVFAETGSPTCIVWRAAN
jgi:hypothetical protein